MIKKVYSKICNLLSNYLGRIFTILLILTSISGYAHNIALSNATQLQRQLMSFVDVTAARLIYQSDSAGWSDYFEQYLDNTGDLYKDTEVKELLSLMSDLDNFSGENTKANEALNTLMDKMEDVNFNLIVIELVWIVLLVLSIVVGTGFVFRILISYIPKEERFRRKLISNWEEDFSNIET